MTELPNTAMIAARRLSPERQDEIARMVLAFARDDLSPYHFTPEEAHAEDAADAEEASGAYATHEDVRAIWAKYGL